MAKAIGRILLEARSSALELTTSVMILSRWRLKGRIASSVINGYSSAIIGSTHPLIVTQEQWSLWFQELRVGCPFCSSMKRSFLETSSHSQAKDQVEYCKIGPFIPSDMKRGCKDLKRGVALPLKADGGPRPCP
jgi:hypothetical protein